MELGQYLICLASRHEKAKDEYEAELKEYGSRSRKKRGGRQAELTYEDERALMKSVVSSLRGKPACLKKLSPPALGCLAYLFKCKMANDPFTEGHEIIEKLVYDPEYTIDYLHGLSELKEQLWIRFLETPAAAFTDQEPFCWLQTAMELGDTFHQQMGELSPNARMFASNDAYLDEVFKFLRTMVRDDGNIYRISKPDTDIYSFDPCDWQRKIVMRIQATSIELPAAR